MEPINSPYTPKNYSKKKYEDKPYNKSNIQPSVPAGPSEYSPEVPQVTPNIPTYEYHDKNQKKIVDLQVYEQKKPNFLADKQANIALQPLALSSPFMPPQFQSYMNNMMKNFYTPFIYKDYNINIGGPNADRMKATVLYEDILPPADVYTSYKSLRERNNLLDYIRSTFINRSEGEHKNFNGDGPNSLNSRLKLVELTPNNPNDFTNNPYVASAHNFLLYHSCYPVMYDKTDHGSQCSKSSTGINLRVYNIYTGEIINLRSNSNYDFLMKIFGDKTFKQGKFYNNVDSLIKNRENIKKEYNSIRDLKYYEFIRNTICKNKHSPNFVQSYCYFLDEETRITFNKNSNKTDGTKYKFKNHEDEWYENAISQLLLILTESPEQSLKYWCSNAYVKDRNVERQIRIGYKPDKVWDSIIAQILLSFYVMLKYQFVIKKMSFEDSLYIKDVNLYNESNQYWLYIINNINYYIPNNGYLLMIDHNYRDNNDEKIKILLDEFKDPDINKTIYENLLKCTETTFFQNNNIIPIDSKNILSQINSDLIKLDSTTFDKVIYEEEILYKYLCKFLNNRIGTITRELEKIKKPEENKTFIKGELGAWEKGEDEYIIVLFIKQSNDVNKFNCIINHDGETEDIDKGLLYNFINKNIINQDIKVGDSSFTLDNVIETYKIY
jgi:hypothetical protein